MSGHRKINDVVAPIKADPKRRANVKRIKSEMAADLALAHVRRREEGAVADETAKSKPKHG